MDRLRFQGSDLCAARVLHEDDDFITLEVPKDETRKLSVQSGDRWFVIAFVKARPRPHVWKPWEAE